MTTDEAAARVRAISAVADDDERAHSMEDALRRRDVLEAIAAGAENPSSLASIALSTSEVPFSRWCA